MRALSEFLDGFDEVLEERDGYVVRCPAHADGRPSLRVALRGDSLMLHCRAGCKKPAVLEALGFAPKDLFGWELGEARVVADAGRRELSGAELDELAELVERCEAAWEPREESEPVWEYAKERFGIDGGLAQVLRLGFAPAGFTGPYVPRPFSEAPRLVVPFLGWDGRPRGLQGRSVGAPARLRWCGLANPAGTSWAMTAVMRAETGSGTLLVTEGPSDGLTAVGAGLDAVAVRGASLGRNEALVADLAEHAQGQRVLVVGDNDDAGAEFAELAEALVAHGVDARVLALPAHAEDLNGWRQDDPIGFPEALLGAVRRAARPGGEAPVPTAAPGAGARPDGARADVAVALDVLEAEGQLRHEPGVGFLAWDGFSWRVDAGKDSPATRAAVHRQGQRYAQEASVAQYEEARKQLNGMAARAQSSRSVDAILKEMAALPGVQVAAEALDAKEHLLAVENGTVDLRTGVLRASDPADLLTAALAVPFDPGARAPGWLAFLEEAADGKEGFADFLQRLVGYGITGSNAEQMFVIHLGRGANGKSVFMDVLGDVFRAITRVTGFGTFEEQKAGSATPELASLRGSRMVMASEGAANRRLDEAMVKRITGGELVEVRQLYREPTVYRPRFLIQLATNHRPGIQGGDEGIWRRVRLVPWTLQVPKAKQDKGLSGRLVREEAQGILAWAVEGARLWYEGGLGEPEFLVEASETFRETSDELGGFMPGVIHQTGRPADTLLASATYLRYQEWCDEEGTRAWGRRAFYNALEERGVDRAKDGSGYLRLHGVADGPEDPGEGPGREVREVQGPRTRTSPTASNGRFQESGPEPSEPSSAPVVGSTGGSEGWVDVEEFF